MDRNSIIFAISIAIAAAFAYWMWGRFNGIDSILAFIKEWQLLGYVILAFFSFGGSFVWTVAAGIASYFGAMNLWIALAVGITFNYIGDMFLFYLGKYQRDEVKPYFEKHKRKLALSTLIMRKYGVWAIFIQKFLYGIKTLVPISMALSKYDFKKFGFYNIFASILFVSVVMISSYYAGESIRHLLVLFKGKNWILMVILLSLVGAGWFWMERVTSKKKSTNRP